MKRVDTKVLFLIIISLVILIVCGCNEYNKNEKRINFDIDGYNSNEELISAIDNYANDVSNNMNLNYIEIIFDTDFNKTIIFKYSKYLLFNNGASLELHYNDKLKQIITYYIIGNRKASQPLERIIDISNWKIKIRDIELIIKEKLLEFNIESFYKIDLICSTHKIYCAIFESSLPNKSINFDIKPD
jgi:hypothetical protein